MIDLTKLEVSEWEAEYDSYCEEEEKHYNELFQWGLENIEGMPCFGNLMTVEDWKEAVGYGVFIDYDGFGEQVLFDGTNYKVGPEISSSEIENLDPTCTHIIWFNR